MYDASRVKVLEPYIKIGWQTIITQCLKEVNPHNLATFNTRFYQNIYRGSGQNEQCTGVGGRNFIP